jgi:hypothetical protein
MAWCSEVGAEEPELVDARGPVRTRERPALDGTHSGWFLMLSGETPTMVDLRQLSE